MNPPTPETATAILAKHAKSFRIASWFLPRAQAQEAALAYSFCRYIDDLADEGSPEAARPALAALQAELLSEVPSDPLVAAIREQAQRLNLPLTPWLELLAGAASDLDGVRMADMPSLLRYCYRVAGTVGWLMCGILGVRDPDALAHAIDLGIAMQLTNICRDVAEDAARGRVYLPQQLLQLHGTDQEALLSGTADTAAIQASVRTLLHTAERWYTSGERGVAYIPLQSRVAILVAGRLYRGIGRRLLRLGANPLLGRTVVPSWEKLLLVCSSLFALVQCWQVHPGQHDLTLHHPLAGLPGIRG